MSCVVAVISACCLQAGSPSVVLGVASVVEAGAVPPVEAQSPAGETSGLDDWGGIRRHRALVNAVGYESDGVPRLSLRGEWDFYAAGKAPRKLIRRNIAKTDNVWRMDKPRKYDRSLPTLRYT